MTALTVGSLFSGIGGLDLGLERAGMRVIWQSEIDLYSSRVLAKHWPDVPNYGDIKEIDWRTITRPDVICGGYPCQPFSTAGNRQGRQDPRHLWPWVLDAISELRPRYVILENVRGHLSLGGLSVIGELADSGYDAEWRIIPASSVGAYHRRERVVIVAYPQGQFGHGVIDNERNSGRPEAFPESRNSCRPENEPGRFWETESGMDRVANGVPDLMDRLKGLGNAVVPQVAELVGRLVIEHSTR
jgi:DNA (cytosine-5)-methyltransferase 1